LNIGKTVNSYRMALQWEIETWKGFGKKLYDEREKEVFQELMESCRQGARVFSTTLLLQEA